MDDHAAKREWVTEALGVRFPQSSGAAAPAVTATSAPASSATVGQDESRALASAKAVWQSAIETIDKQIERARGAMSSSGDPALRAIADRGLPALTENHKTPVMKALIELDGAAGDARKKAAAKGLAAVQAFRSHIGQSGIVKVLDDHAQVAFGVKMTIGDEIGRGLDALEPAFKSAAA